MTDIEAYRRLVEQYPERFANKPGGIEILLDPAEMQQAQATIAQQLATRGLPPAWAEVGVAFEDQYLLILRDAVRFPDNSLGTYIRITGMEANVPGVIILPVYQGQVLLVRHFRHAIRDWMIELPRGFGERGKTAEENARRELQEEIGAEVRQFVALGKLNTDGGMFAGYDELFYADVTSVGKLALGEGISDLLPVSVALFEQMIERGEITDGYTLAAYTRAKLKGLLG